VCLHGSPLSRNRISTRVTSRSGIVTAKYRPRLEMFILESLNVVKLKRDYSSHTSAKYLENVYLSEGKGVQRPWLSVSRVG
jgi:hypothetical protein